MSPCRVIPPPFAVVSVGVVTLPSSMFLSSTTIVATSIVVVSPCTIRSPVIVTLSPKVTSDDECPIVTGTPLEFVPILIPVVPSTVTVSPSTSTSPNAFNSRSPPVDSIVDVLVPATLNVVASISIVVASTSRVWPDASIIVVALLPEIVTPSSPEIVNLPDDVLTLDD